MPKKKDYCRNLENLISSFPLQNGTLIIPLLLFYFHFGLVCTKTRRFVEYTPKKGFNSFVLSAVDARRQCDENPNSSVVAETMKLLANSSYGYQIMDRSQHTVAKYLIDEKTHAAINSKLFKKFDHVNNSLYEVELAKAQIEDWTQRTNHCRLLYSSIRKTANVGAVLQLLHQILWCKQARRVGNGHRFTVPCSCREGTGGLYKAWNEREWQRFRSNDCVDIFAADAVAKFFPWTCCVKHKQHDKREPGLFKEEFGCTETLCLCSKAYCCYDVTSNNFKFNSECFIKRVLEESGNGLLEKYRWVLNETVNVTSNNRGFRTNNHSVATYEQVKKGLSYFYPTRIAETDGNHPQPLKM